MNMIVVLKESLKTIYPRKEEVISFQELVLFKLVSVNQDLREIQRRDKIMKALLLQENIIRLIIMKLNFKMITLSR